MPRIRHRLLILAGVGLVALAALWFNRREPALPRITLADGTTVRVVAHAIQRVHFSPYDSALGRVISSLPDKLYRYLPIALQRRAARPVCSTPNPTLAVWLEWDGIPTAAVTNSIAGSASFHLFLGDHRSYLIRAFQELSGRDSNGRYYEGHIFPSPPTAQPTIAATLYRRIDPGDNPTAATVLGRWQWRNQTAETSTNWVAQPLPQVCQIRELEVSLIDLIIDAETDRGTNPVVAAIAATDAWNFARFELREQGMATTNWRIQGLVALTDAAGNRNSETITTTGTDWIRWRWALWPDQPWQLAFEFTRTGRYASNELVTVSGLELGMPLPRKVESPAGFVEVRQMQTASDDRTKLELKVAYHGRGTPGRLTLLTVSDVSGRVLKSEAKSQDIYSFGTNVIQTATFSIDSGTPARVPFSATFALVGPTIATFQATPRFLGTNSP